MWVKTIALDKVFVILWRVFSLKKCTFLLRGRAKSLCPSSPFSVPLYAPEVLIRIPSTFTSDLSICFVSTSAVIVTRAVRLFS